MYNLLLLDDDESILSALSRIIRKKHPWKVYTCSEANHAITVALNHKIDLFISDYRMPGMNGVDFLIEARKMNPDAMRLILSGQTDNQGLQDAINNAEIYRFIEKPVNPDVLITTIEQALQVYELKRENRRLLEEVKRHKEQIKHKDLAFKKLQQDHPDLASVDWDDDGSIMVDESDL